MLCASKEIRLKTGEKAMIVPPEPEMAAEMLDLLRDASFETEFISWKAEEIGTLETERAILEVSRMAQDSMMFVCLVDGMIVGNSTVDFRCMERTRHRATIGIVLRQQYWNKGIGTALFTEMIQVAKEQGIRQLELGVIDGNERGMALYTKMGFTITGRFPDAYKMQDGTFRDEIYMVKML